MKKDESQYLQAGIKDPFLLKGKSSAAALEAFDSINIVEEPRRIRFSCFIIMFCFNQDATAFYQPFPTQPYLLQRWRRKPTIFKAIPSSFWCVFQPCWSISVALAVGLLFSSLASKAPPLLGQGEAEGLFVISQFLLFHRHDSAQQSSLSFHFSLVWRYIVT